MSAGKREIFTRPISIITEQAKGVNFKLRQLNTCCKITQLDPILADGKVGLEHGVHGRGQKGKGPDSESLNNRVVCLVHARQCTSNFLCVCFDPNSTSK